LLPNGKVLVAGGGNLSGALRRAELYDPATGAWTRTGDLNVARYEHTATLLPNGKVLVVGGSQLGGPVLNSAELYDPATGAWTTTSSLNVTRQYYTATLLLSGKVLVAGGWPGSGTSAFNSAELYDSGTPTVASVSAASFRGPALAPQSIVAAFGTGLATTTQGAAASDSDPNTPGVQLPTTLAGTQVAVRDSLGVERLAPLFYVRSDQVNYQIPSGTAPGTAIVTITSGDGQVSAGTAQIATVAPGLFGANANGQGVAAAYAVRVKPGNVQSLEIIARFDPAQGIFVAVPLDLGPESESVVLVLYGTGLRHRSSLTAVSVKIGGVESPVGFADAAPDFVGLDQVNVLLPRSLIGRGEVDVVLSVDGQAANPVRLNIR
jgi:uncharacterized protein (TIGR03437 family)